VPSFKLVLVGDGGTGEGERRGLIGRARTGARWRAGGRAPAARASFAAVALIGGHPPWRRPRAGGGASAAVPACRRIARPALLL
jgi:hypothetical protein